MAVAVAKKVGARHVIATDVNDFRLELAEACGAVGSLTVHKNEKYLSVATK